MLKFCNCRIVARIKAITISMIKFAYNELAISKYSIIAKENLGPYTVVQCKNGIAKFSFRISEKKSCKLCLS